MASNGIASWSTTAANNVQSLTGTNWDEGQAPSTVNDSARTIMADLAQWYANFGINLLENLSLTLSVGSNALTIAIKRRDGSDPTAANPVRAAIRSATAANGDYSIISLTGATSLVISSGSKLGTVDNEPFRIWLVMFNDGGTFRIGAVRATTGTDAAGWNTMALGAWGIASSTAEGGAGGADSAQVIYTGTGVTSKPYHLLGYATWESGLATAGTWSAAPTRVQLFGHGVSLPGETVARVESRSGAVATGTTTIADDDNIKQNTEGDQYFTVSQTPTSAANILRARAQLIIAHSNGSGSILAAALFRDSTANAYSSVSHVISATTAWELTISGSFIANTGSSTTTKLRAGAANAGTTTINGSGGARKHGGKMDSYLEQQEIMA